MTYNGKNQKRDGGGNWQDNWPVEWRLGVELEDDVGSEADVGPEGNVVPESSAGPTSGVNAEGDAD